jgi:hypothetical protein
MFLTPQAIVMMIDFLCLKVVISQADFGGCVHVPPRLGREGRYMAGGVPLHSTDQ